MTPKELFKSLTDSKRQEMAENIVRSGIIMCQSYLVEHLLSKENEEFSIDDIENYQIQNNENAIYNIMPHWEENEIEWIEYANNPETFNRRVKTKNDFEVFLNSLDDYDLKNFCDAFTFQCDYEPQEIFEWWAVNEWLANKLRAQGEPIIDNNFGIWWGRTCTGQSICLDHNIQMIACELESDIQNDAHLAKLRMAAL